VQFCALSCRFKHIWCIFARMGGAVVRAGFLGGGVFPGVMFDWRTHYHLRLVGVDIGCLGGGGVRGGAHFLCGGAARERERGERRS